jgi:peptidyl-prolyl cis-trans isomerase C
MTLLPAACTVALLCQSPQGAVPAPARDATVVAESGGVTVTTGELRDAMREARQSGDPKQMLNSMTPEGLEEIARGILERKLLAQEARAAGIERQPDVARAIDRSADAILARALLEREAARLDTSDAALRRYYASHEAEFRTGPRRKARQIWVKTESEAAAALAEVKAGSPFEDVATARNIDAAKANGGDLGWVPRGVMVPAFEDALFALGRSGEVSGIVRTSVGFHIIRVDEVDPGSLASFDDAREQVRQLMVNGAVARVTADVARRHPATIHKETLGALAAGGK